jgi:endonuclease-3
MFNEKEILLINNLLKKRFGTPGRSKKPPNPVDLLIATILSQNTNDRNSYKAFQNLKKKYSNWEETAIDRVTSIEKVIKIAGLGKQKSAAIKNFLSSLIKERGKVSLKHLKNLSDEDVLAELTKYPGVGVKTASCVLLFSLGRNICPVDTHVHRTLNRIGIVDAKTPDKTFLALLNNIPDNTAHSFHTNLIKLGREICRPTKPNCSCCPLIEVCEYKFKNLTNEKIYKENSFMLLDNV